MEEKTKITRSKIIKRILLILIIAVAVVALSTATVFLCINHVNKEGDKNIVYYDYQKKETKFDYGIVPGAAVRDGVLSNKLAQRLNMACRLYKDGNIKKIIISDTDSEVILAMSEYLKDSNIPESDVWRDYYGKDTYSTINRAYSQFEGASICIFTQEEYAQRAGYIINSFDSSGRVVIATDIIYQMILKDIYREGLAKFKACLNVNIPFTAGVELIKNQELANGFSEEKLESGISAEQYNSDLITIYIEEKESDISNTKGEKYDAKAAVAYALKYGTARNPKYPNLNNNCTNFVSQCLLAGGLKMDGSGTPKKDIRISFNEDSSKWYCDSKSFNDERPPNYASSTSFMKSDTFFDYWINTRNIEFEKINNDFAGRENLYKHVKLGDVACLYDDEDNIKHVGLITKIDGNMVYFSANTNDSINKSLVMLSDQKYKSIGILHMD